MFYRLEIAVLTLITLLFVLRSTVFGHVSDSDSDNDDDDDLSPVRTCAGCRMSAFFAKLNALRRDHRERRRTSNRPPTFFRPATSVRQHTAAAAVGDGDSGLGSPPPPDDELRTDGAAVETDDGSTAKGREDVTITNRNVSTTFETRGRRSQSRPRPPAAGEHLRMGWRTVRCLWRRYWEADAKREALAVRGRLGRVMRFWAAVAAVSATLLWAAFGYFHGLFCACVFAPPVAYAKQVNKYLTMVPPHVVVTDRGKMFRYRPTAEERFLWECAKKMASFRV